MMKILKLTLILTIINFTTCIIDTDIQIDGLYPPDIDHDWRFNWNVFPNKLQIASKYLPVSFNEKFPQEPVKPKNKIESERKTFMDFASMLPIPNAEALMAASGVSVLQNMAQASVPNIPKLMSNFFSIKNMFNNRNQLLPLLRSREYRIQPDEMMSDRQLMPRNHRMTFKRNVTRRFKRPIVVAPLDLNTIESSMNEVKLNKSENFVSESPVQAANEEESSIERHTFVNSDFVGIPAPIGYEAARNPKTFIPEKHHEEKLSSKLPVRSRFVMRNPLETKVHTSYRTSDKNLFNSPPVMEDKFFTTSLGDLFQSPSNRQENQKNNNKIVIVTDDDIYETNSNGKNQNRPRMPRPRPRMPKSRSVSQSRPENRKPPMELPVYIQEQRQMTGMHPPPIQIPNIFMGDDETSQNEIKPSKKTDMETKNCDQQKQRKNPKPKLTKNPVHSSVMDIITNHSREPSNNQNNAWSYQQYSSSTTTPRPPMNYNQVSQKPGPATSNVEMIQEFNSWSPGPVNDDWAPNTPPFKPLSADYPSNIDILRGFNDNSHPDSAPYFNPDQNDDQDDDLEYPAESKKVVRVMMPEIKLPNKLPMPQQQFQLQSQQFQKKLPSPSLSNMYSGYPGTTSNIEQQRFPSPHMMLNDGLLFQRYNLLKEIEQMQSNLFGGNDLSDPMMSNPMMPGPMMSSPIISSPIISSPSVSSGPVMFSGNPGPAPGPNVQKTGSYTQNGKPMKLMKFRVL